ncbi:MAG: NAD dependent epimerase/dehydratase [Chitinophagales bacterium]|nr:MAG: NAD dependent epimerase/dehydratase [Chitinophagales bacterium]
MDIRGKKFLVIGGAGFIGSHVVDQLLAEDVKEVVIYDNFSRGRLDNIENALRDPRCKVFELGGDILHQDILNAAMKGTDGVFYLAALWLLHCHDYPRSAFEVNIRGCFNVIESAIQNQVQRVVYSSSASVYGNAVEIPMREDHPFNNDTFYGATKIAGEQMFHSLGKRYGLNWVGLRYMNVYGPRQDYKGAYIAVMHKILDRLDRNEKPVIYGDGSQQYDFIAVEDVARANICAMKADVSGACYNVGRGIGTSIKELAELLIRLSGKSIDIQYEPAGLTFVTNRIGSTEKAEKDLGFKWQIGLEEGMKKLIEWRNTHKEALKARQTTELV